MNNDPSCANSVCDCKWKENVSFFRALAQQSDITPVDTMDFRKNSCIAGNCLGKT